VTDTPIRRRRFLNFITNVLMALIALLLAIPAVSYFLAPLRRRRDEKESRPPFQDVGPLADIPLGIWSLWTLEIVQADGWKKTRVRHSIWVRRQGEGEKGITVLSPICPHLGCPINWHPDQSQFVCPCHGGIFSTDGLRLSGPPPRNMDPLEFEIREGWLRIRWQDFKIGVAERIPVNV
jgi:menaquinol-cytochrome c reductase iron-sulfur subunit